MKVIRSENPDPPRICKPGFSEGRGYALSFRGKKAVQRKLAIVAVKAANAA